MHEAQYLEPVMRNIETFLDDTQNLSREVEVELRPYHFAVLGCSSEFDLRTLNLENMERAINR